MILIFKRFIIQNEPDFLGILELKIFSIFGVCFLVNLGTKWVGQHQFLDTLLGDYRCITIVSLYALLQLWLLPFPKLGPYGSSLESRQTGIRFGSWGLSEEEILYGSFGNPT